MHRAGQHLRPASTNIIPPSQQRWHHSCDRDHEIGVRAALFTQPVRAAVAMPAAELIAQVSGRPADLAAWRQAFAMLSDDQIAPGARPAMNFRMRRRSGPGQT